MRRASGGAFGLGSSILAFRDCLTVLMPHFGGIGYGLSSLRASDAQQACPAFAGATFYIGNFRSLTVMAIQRTRNVCFSKPPAKSGLTANGHSKP